MTAETQSPTQSQGLSASQKGIKLAHIRPRRSSRQSARNGGELGVGEDSCSAILKSDQILHLQRSTRAFPGGPELPADEIRVVCLSR